MRSAICFFSKIFVELNISYNSGRRAAVRNAFEKDRYKLKNYSSFGATMEDVRHRIEYLFLTRWEKVERLSSSPLFVDADIFSEGIVGVQMFKNRLELSEHVYIGQAVIDYSKLEV